MYVVQFFEGMYFRRPLAERTQAQLKVIANDPLYQPLRAIGVDEAGIRRVFKQCSRGLIQRWIRVTDTAVAGPTIGDRRTFYGLANSVHGFQTPFFARLHCLYKASFKAASVEAETNGLSPVCFDKNS